MVAKSLFAKIEPILTIEVARATVEDRRKLEALLKGLQEKEKVLKELDNEILNILNPEDMETDMEATIEFELEMSIFYKHGKKIFRKFQRRRCINYYINKLLKRTTGGQITNIKH